MKKIIRVIGTEDRTSKAGDDYHITHVLCEDGTECEYFGKDIRVGDEVMIFFHKGKVKAMKKEA